MVGWVLSFCSFFSANFPAACPGYREHQSSASPSICFWRAQREYKPVLLIPYLSVTVVVPLSPVTWISEWSCLFLPCHPKCNLVVSSPQAIFCSLFLHLSLYVFLEACHLAMPCYGWMPGKLYNSKCCCCHTCWEGKACSTTCPNSLNSCRELP